MITTHTNRPEGEISRLQTKQKITCSCDYQSARELLPGRLLRCTVPPPYYHIISTRKTRKSHTSTHRHPHMLTSLKSYCAFCCQVFFICRKVSSPGGFLPPFPFLRCWGLCLLLPVGNWKKKNHKKGHHSISALSLTIIKWSSFISHFYMLDSYAWQLVIKVKS